MDLMVNYLPTDDFRFEFKLWLETFGIHPTTFESILSWYPMLIFGYTFLVIQEHPVTLKICLTC